MPSNPTTETDAAGLSAEERAALAPDTDEAANLKAVLEDGGETVEEAPDEKPADKPVEAAAAEAPAKSGEEKPEENKPPEVAAAAAEEPAPSAVREVPFVPRSDVQPVENYDTRMQELDTKRKEVVQRFKAGEIQLDEMMAEKDRIDDERSALRQQQTDYENTARREEQYERQLWGSQVASFQRQHPEYGLIPSEDGKSMVPANPAMYYALDGIVKQLGSDPRHVAEHGNDGLWYLEEAHKKVQAQLAAKPASEAKPAVDTKPAVDPKKAAAAARKPDLKVVPKTLGGLPAAEVPETGTPDEFAHLDKLEGIELENAVRRLSPDQQARYASNLGY